MSSQSSAFPRHLGERLTRIWAATVQREARSSELSQVFFCAAAGSAVGALVSGLHRGIEWLHTVAFDLPEGAALSTGIGVSVPRILFLPLIGGLLIGLGALIVRRFRSSDIADPIEANALHGGRMSMIDSLRLVIATIVSNAVGASVGMEAGYSQFGSSVFASLGQWLKLRRADQRTFVASGAAAAIAAAFNAPLAGAFYAYELILGNYSVRALAPIAAASLASVMTERALIDPVPLFAVSQAFHFKQSVYLLFALLGLLSAGFSVLAMQAVAWAERYMRLLPLPQWLRPGMGGLLLTVIALYVPQVLGSGHGAIQFHFDNNWTLTALIVVLIAKLLASALSIGSGFRGGMFSSSLLLGCLFGAVFADVAAMILPRLGEQHAALMMVGMGSVAAAVIGAPLTMVFLVLEGTGDFPMTVGVMTGVVIASTIVRLTFGYSFSTWRFHQRGLGIRSPHDIGWLADLTVAKLMRADPKIVPANITLGSLRSQFPLGGPKRVFVVRGTSYVGAIDIMALHDKKNDARLDSVTAGEAARDGDAFLLPGQNVRVALSRFEESLSESLPVLASIASREVVGYMTEAYALRRYSQELERRRNADLGQRDLFSISEPGATGP
ncbi:MAG: chloride channel protein [Alphaproteobacteria bacterium]|nr:chloride channel protein [Alphaproteobacteria bacterium]MBL6939602.1 chloride channel protein [Alphaproteobacteria bacterium]MBL7100025.1 chloride channel protein [Alphaproteobacteria bacterium]